MRAVPHHSICESASAEPHVADGNRPVSLNQEGRLLHDETKGWSKVSRAPHFPLAFRIVGAFNLSNLERALNVVIARHEGLRTDFVHSSRYTAQDRRMQLLTFLRTGLFVPGLYEQHVRDDGHIGLCERHVETTEEPALTLVVEEEITKAASSDTPHRPTAVVIRAERGASVLLVVLSHLLADGWSVQVFQRELMALYGAYERGSQPPPRAASPRYSDFVVTQHREIITGGMNPHAAYWREQWSRLGDAAVMHHEIPFHRHDASTPAIEMQRHQTSPLETQASLAAARRLGTFPYVLFRTAFTAILHHYTGKRRIAYWANFANRRRTDEDLFGWVAHTHLLTTELDADDRWSSACSRTATAVRDAQTHEALPLQAVWRHTGKNLAAHLNGRINFDIWPTLRGTAFHELLEPMIIAGGRRWMDLDVRLRAEAGQFTLVATYNASRYDRLGVAEMISLARALLRHTAGADLPVGIALDKATSLLRNHPCPLHSPSSGILALG